MRQVNGRVFEFDWDEAKAESNIRRHGVSFEFASGIFYDPRLLTIADLDHSETEERWFSVGIVSTGGVLSVVYLWSEDSNVTKIRLISARKATQAEIGQYLEGL